MARRKKSDPKERNGDDGVDILGNENIGEIEIEDDIVEVQGWVSKRRGNRKFGQRKGDGGGGDGQRPINGSLEVPGSWRNCKKADHAFGESEQESSTPQYQRNMVQEEFTEKKRQASKRPFETEEEFVGGVSKRIREHWDDDRERLVMAFGATSLSPERGESNSLDKLIQHRKKHLHAPRNSQVQCSPYPVLPQEPDLEAVDMCRVCVRFPDGKRVQRRFFLSDPIQFLWSLCALEDKAAGNGKPFRLMHAVPGSASTLHFGIRSSISETGIAGSLLSLIWD